MTQIEQAIAFYFDRPVEYVVDIIGVTPDDVQAQVIQSVADEAMTSVRSGHGVGKSALEAWCIKWFMFTRPFPKIPCTAPTKHQLYDILWAEVAKWNTISKDREWFTWTYEKFYLKECPENWFAVPRTATKPDALQGFHATHLLFIIDEASGVEDIVFEPVLGALSTEGAKLLMCGNPTQIAGFFYDSHNKNRDQYKVYKIDGRTSQRVSNTFVQMIIEMYGEDSDVFRVRVAGDFPKSLPDVLIPLDWCERNSKREKEIHMMVGSTQIIHVDIGVDVARYGDDESVLCPVLNDCLMEPLEKYFHNNTMRITGVLVQMIDRYESQHNLEQIWAESKAAEEMYGNDAIPIKGLIDVKIDCDGLGVGVYDRLCEIIEQRQGKGEWLNVIAYEVHFGGEGGKLNDEHPVQFKNKASLMWGNAREKLRTDSITCSYDDKLISQLSTRKYKIESEGMI